MINNMKNFILLIVAAVLFLTCALPRAAVAQTTTKKTLAVLPFIYGNAAEKKLAERMRFAVSAKISRDGTLDRMDNIQVDQMLSALQIPWSTEMPADDDVTKVITNVGADQTITGTVHGRTLTLHLFQGDKQVKTAAVDIPGDVESPKLAVEHVITELLAIKFQHIREVECDHSNPEIEKLWKQQPNLAPDPGFELAASAAQHAAMEWSAVLGADEYHPPLITAAAAANLPKDKVAIVPKSFATGHADQGHCLLMRMSKDVAENNGLACICSWIPVEDSKMYRFTCQYLSKGPSLHLFLNGYAYKADQFGNKNDPEAVRRQAYRYQVVPRSATKEWTLIEADFTPSAQTNKLKPEDTLKVQWVRLNLYVYLGAGDVFFDDITLKKIAP